MTNQGPQADVARAQERQRGGQSEAPARHIRLERLIVRPSVLLLPVALAALSACGASTPTHSSAAAPAASVVSSPTNALAASTPAASTARRVIQVTEHSTDTYTPKGGQPAPGGPTGMPAAGDQFDIRSTLVRADKTGLS